MKRALLVVSGLLLCGLLFASGQKATAGKYPDHPADQPFKVAVDMGFVPHSFLNEKGEAEGFGVDLAKALAKELGRPGAEIVDVDWSGIFAALFAKKVEMVSAVATISKERAEQMDFTEPMFDSDESIAINVKDKDNIKTLEDLKGKTIGANTGSMGDVWLQKNKDKYGFIIDQYEGMPLAAQAVQVGRIDGVIGDSDAIGYYVRDKKELVNALLIKTGEKCALPFRKGDPYRDVVNDALVRLKKNGTLANIYTKWFGPPDKTSSVVVIYPGYGLPGLPGYKEKAK